MCPAVEPQICQYLIDKIKKELHWKEMVSQNCNFSSKHKLFYTLSEHKYVQRFETCQTFSLEVNGKKKIQNNIAKDLLRDGKKGLL